MKTIKDIKIKHPMKPSTKKWLASLSLGVVLFSACDSDALLQKTPPTRISSNEVFSSPTRIEGLVNGIYSALKSTDFYSGRLLLFWDVRAEEFINTTSNAYSGFESWNNIYSSGSNDVVSVWNIGYTVINRANVLIDGLENNPAVISDSQKKMYIAEAKFARALSYFSLVTSFAQPYQKDNGASPGLPLRLQAENGPDNNDLARSTVAQVYTQILQDLTDAEADLPANYSSALLSTTRAHKNTAIALKTRVLLTKGDYPGVVTEAKKIVAQTQAPFSSTQNIQHQLMPNLEEVMETQNTSFESIFSMPFTELNMVGGQSALGHLYNVGSEYFLSPNGIFGHPQWRDGDERKEMIRYHAATNRTFLTKFGKSAPFLQFMPVLRYAEVLLNYAEAAAETNNLDLAYELLQAVHKRSDADFDFPVSLKQNKEEMIETILLERRIELIGEGFRSNDLLRRLKTIPGKIGGGHVVEPVSPNMPNYIWPVSNNELINNKLF